MKHIFSFILSSILTTALINITLLLLYLKTIFGGMFINYSIVFAPCISGLTIFWIWLTHYTFCRYNDKGHFIMLFGLWLSIPLHITFFILLVLRTDAIVYIPYWILFLLTCVGSSCNLIFCIISLIIVYNKFKIKPL